MIVSWNWLKDYVMLDMDSDQVAHRLAMAGLNHESTETIGDDLAIDLEVTSNRPDCLGHVGVAREIAVLWDRRLSMPTPAPAESTTPVGDLTRVTLDGCIDLCYRYTARVVRGVKVGPSPDWLADRLRAIGIAVINNIVDVTNYVMMECGQPLHAFDFAELAGPEIVVRQAEQDEQFLAIDHRAYTLQKGMCVIGDARRAVALGGVMGGATTEVSERTVDVLVEAAEFVPISIRGTARKLNLHSPSSYRFERGVDPEGVDWASRRCCELILDLAGGELAAGVIDVGRDRPEAKPITLRLSQLKRILGIEVDVDAVCRILTALGHRDVSVDQRAVRATAPSWRRDLTREIDLVEEVARIHGYDKIPEDVAVPMAPSHRDDEDRVVERVRHVLTAAGLDEALTPSVVGDDVPATFSPWSEGDDIRCHTPMLRGADRLRRSLVPSLLNARRINESLANPVIELFELAKVYLAGADRPVEEQTMLSITSGEDFRHLKGVVEGLVAALNPTAQLEVVGTRQHLLDPARSCQLRFDGEVCGYLGQLSREGVERFDLRRPATVAELRLEVLGQIANLVPQHQQQSPYPAIDHDLNLIVDERVRWSDLAATVGSAGGECLERIAYRETYRNARKDGAGKKRLLLSISLRSADRTLTSDQAIDIRDRIVAACQDRHGAALLG